MNLVDIIFSILTEELRDGTSTSGSGSSMDGNSRSGSSGSGFHTGNPSISTDVPTFDIQSSPTTITSQRTPTNNETATSSETPTKREGPTNHMESFGIGQHYQSMSIKHNFYSIQMGNFV